LDAKRHGADIRGSTTVFRECRQRFDGESGTDSDSLSMVSFRVGARHLSRGILALAQNAVRASVRRRHSETRMTADKAIAFIREHGVVRARRKRH
jgi:hypothetical protein